MPLIQCRDCSSVLCRADQLLCTERRWGLEQGPSEAACYVNGILKCSGRVEVACANIFLCGERMYSYECRSCLVSRMSCGMRLGGSTQKSGCRTATASVASVPTPIPLLVAIEISESSPFPHRVRTSWNSRKAGSTWPTLTALSMPNSAFPEYDRAPACAFVFSHCQPSHDWG